MDASIISAMLVVPVSAGSQDITKPQLTFTKDVAPIFQEKCQSCHREGYIAPMSLVTSKRHGHGSKRSRHV